ncbi:hypothetical protein HPB50_001417 [Hyalomma asiaticum]|uniref:Uncharacterized protein n=1 Tax=Hyalomma asiaticum TaxID=266040 RepID=A0ACB7TDD2_HYAAI|nr:hypothetical protein HPB50_001417 [Hyalomma asiaticum]
MPGVFIDDIRALKRKIEQFDIERYRGAMVRARAERLITKEAPSKRALGSEKWHARRNQIVEIDCDGEVSDTAEHIERAFYEHYSDLFTDCSVDAERFQKEFLTLMPRLEDSAKEILEEPISEDEVKSAIEIALWAYKMSHLWAVTFKNADPVK